MSRLRRRLIVAFYRWRRRRSRTTVYFNPHDVLRIQETGELVVVTRCETVSIGTNDFVHWAVERRVVG